MNEFVASRTKAYAYTSDEWNYKKGSFENNGRKKIKGRTETTRRRENLKNI